VEVEMRRPLTLTKALAASFVALWLVWNVLTIQLTLELAAVRDPWQPWLTVLRVLFPFMHFGATFIPSWLALLGYAAFPTAFVILSAWLFAEDWSFRHGMIAGGVWAGAAAVSAFVSPPGEQAGRLYHLARFEIGEALAYLAITGVIAFVLVALVLNAAVVFGVRFARRWGLFGGAREARSEAPAAGEPAPESTAPTPESAEEA
jgi:hypothetical protein